MARRIAEGDGEIMERPILFSTKMVQAILEGRKTQTRRVIKPQPKIVGQMGNTGCYGIKFLNIPGKGPVWDHCPYGQTGDTLWVRETWCPMEKYFGLSEKGNYAYKADCSPESEQCRKDFGIPWHPSIHMPKVACRLFLKVKDIRVERLQEITGKDILSEGVDNGKSNPIMGVRWENMQRIAFQELWDKINSGRGYGWDINPWVWVIEFERAKIGE
jgi:hypothetical protein